MQTETALPIAPEATASGQPEAELLTKPTTFDAETGEEVKEEQAEGEPKTKPEKTEEQRRIDKLQRGIDRRTRREAEARAELAQTKRQLEELLATQSRATNSPQQDDAPLTLSRAELAQMVKSEAEKLAPTLNSQKAEIEHRTKVIEGLAKDLGKERFDELAADLDENLGGLQRNGKATPATEAIFAADDPKAVIEYLADPEHADEAEAIGRMDLLRAGRAIAKLETKLEQSKALDKPRRSNAPEPVEPAKRGGGVISNMPDPSNVKAYIKWANEQDRRSH